MKFYCIDNLKSPGIAVGYLEKACAELGVEFEKIIVEKFDATKLSRLEAGSCLYRVAVGKLAADIEKFFIDDGVATFYNEKLAPHGAILPSYVALKNSNIPMPKTITTASTNREVLKNYAEHLGGFPLIAKVMGGSQGVGVIKIDSLQSLYSIADFLNKKEEKYILREFIETTKSARLAVVGDKVVASMEYQATGGDFRSNNRVNKESANAKKYEEETEKIAIEAVRLRGLEFGGVDILIDKKGNNYLIEVNYPFSFPDVQRVTGIDIAREMVSYLKNKAELLKKKSEYGE